jgi:hypothetical protein
MPRPPVALCPATSLGIPRHTPLSGSEPQEHFFGRLGAAYYHLRPVTMHRPLTDQHKSGQRSRPAELEPKLTAS